MKTILILSGGMDSTTLLYHLRNEGSGVRCLGINYGQRHGKELQCAAKICASIGVEYRIADLTSLKPMLAGSSLTDDTVPVPLGHYSAKNMAVTVVPNRNALMLSCAVAWAISTRSDSVAYAAHAGDHAQYPDCREEFASAFNTVALLADNHKVRLNRPFLLWTKAQIATRAKELNVPLGDTWTCYAGGDVACGKCGTCVERVLSCHEAGFDDTMQYVQPWAAVLADALRVQRDWDAAHAK